MDVILLNGGITDGKTLMRAVGPYKLRHWMNKHGYSAQIVDYVDRVDLDILVKAIKRFITSDTVLIGVSSTFMTCSDGFWLWKSGIYRSIPEHVIEALKIIKNDHPNIKFMVGGYVSDKLSSFGVFDVSMMSYTTPNEDILLEYVQHLKTGSKKPIGSIIFVPGEELGSPAVARMHFEGANNRLYNIEVDDFRFADNDHILPNEPLPMDVSRGCIFACRFCQYPYIGKKKLDYIRGMSFIEEEMNINYEKFGTTGYYILDDTFNDTETKVESFLRMSERLPFDLSFSAYLRADLLDRFADTPHMLKEAGLTGAFHGIESLHPEASKVVGKAWSGKHGKEYLPKLQHEIWNDEVSMHLSFIIGLPGETPADIDDTVKWIADNKIHSARFHALGLYGDSENSRKTILSEFDRNVEKYGFKITARDRHGLAQWENENWTSKSAKEKSNELAQYFNDNTKLASWSVQALRWYGFSMKYILNTNRRFYPSGNMAVKTDYLVKVYYGMLMGEPIAYDPSLPVGMYKRK